MEQWSLEMTLPIGNMDFESLPVNSKKRCGSFSSPHGDMARLQSLRKLDFPATLSRINLAQQFKGNAAICLNACQEDIFIQVEFRVMKGGTSLTPHT